MLLERWGSAQYYMVWFAPISALESTGARPRLCQLEHHAIPPAAIK